MATKKGLILFRPARYIADVVRQSRKVAQQTGRHPGRILAEQIRLRIGSQLSRHEYFMYELFDPNKSIDQKLAFLPEHVAHMPALWSTMNPPQYWQLLTNKYMFGQLCRASGVRVPEFYGLFDVNVGSSVTGQPLKTVADLDSWLGSLQVEDPVFKPVEGNHGLMVLVFRGRKTGDPHTLCTLNGAEFDAGKLYTFMTDPALQREHFPNQVARKGTFSFLIEGRVKQHPMLTELVGDTLSTVRIVTLVDLAGEVRIIASVLKIQPESSGVDNLAQGAIVAPVDLEKGNVGIGRRIRQKSVENCRTIPGTSKSIEGFVVPYWEQVTSLAKKAARVVPWCRCIGWDIAVANDGPIVLEGNQRWSVKVVQLATGKGIMDGDLKVVYDALRKRPSPRVALR